MQKRRLLLLPLLLCTTWVGCSDAPEPKPIEEPPDAGPRDVRVRRFSRHLTERGLVEQPEDFTRAPVELLVPEGDTFVPVTGRPGGAGEYVFPGVTAQTFYLKTGNAYVVTDSRDVDLSTYRLGRPDVQELEQDSLASVSLEGLEAWVDPRVSYPSSLTNPSSELNFISPELGVAGSLLPDLEAGATALRQEEVPLSIWTGDMVRFDKEKGDRAWVVQVNPRPLGPLPGGGTQHYLTAVRALQLPPFSYEGPAPVPVAGTLQPLTLNELPLDWKVSAFAAHAAEAHPAATLNTSTFTLSPSAYGQANGWVGYSGDLLSLERPPAEASDATGTLVYGNPFPASWGVVGRATTRFLSELPVPGERAVRMPASLFVADRADVLRAGPIVPRILPPRALTLDGTAAHGARTLTAGSHVLAWQPPASGTPVAYIVHLYRLDPRDEGRPRLPLYVGGIYVDGATTSVRLPAGFLEAGKLYALKVTAVAADTFDVKSRPFTANTLVSWGTAETLTGVLSIE